MCLCAIQSHFPTVKSVEPEREKRKKKLILFDAIELEKLVSQYLDLGVMESFVFDRFPIN